MANRNMEELLNVELMMIYDKWVDNSVFDGLDTLNDDDYEKYCEICDELRGKYGIACVLRPDAPPEAVAAWREHGRRTDEADKQGFIID